jgi:hypothetical protein
MQDRDEATALALKDVVEATYGRLAHVAVNKRLHEALLAVREDEVLERALIPLDRREQIDVELNPFLLRERKPADEVRRVHALLLRQRRGCALALRVVRVVAAVVVVRVVVRVIAAVLARGI